MDGVNHSPQLREMEPTLSVKGDFGDVSSASVSDSFTASTVDGVGGCHTRNDIRMLATVR